MKLSLKVLTLLLSLPLISSAKDLPKDNSLYFIENTGQITDQYHKPRTDIDFKLQANSVTLFVGDGQLHYQWTRSQKEELKNNKEESNTTTDSADDLSIYRMDVTLIGADKHAAVMTEEIGTYQEHTYNSRYKGTAANSYKRITYKNIYPQIDWVLYIRDGKVKYDFIVHNGGNAANIKLRYDGATSIALQDGALIAHTPYGSITEDAPYCYSNTTGEEIPSAYLLQDNILSFALPQGHTNMTIDPQLNWATYYGGTGDEFSTDIDADTAGNVYMVSTTMATTNIATSGSYRNTINGGRAIFLVKFNKLGQRQWATYYDSVHTITGGSARYSVFLTVSKNSGDVYIANQYTYDSSLGTAGVYAPNPKFKAMTGLYRHGYVAKFNTTNGQRLWHTYVGLDTIQSSVYDISIDNITDNIYVVGGSEDTAIATVNTYKQQPSQTTQAQYLLKLNSSGQRVWGTFLDNNTAISAALVGLLDVQCDDLGHVYVCGITNIDTGIATTGTYQTSRSSTGSNSDGFVCKFSSSGQKLWGTYIGGTGRELALDLSCDGNKAIYITGYTESTNGIATTGAYQTTFASGASSAIFIMKLNTSGTNRIWGTYYVPPPVSSYSVYQTPSIATLNNGDIVITQCITASGWATSGALKTAPQAADILLSRFNSNGQRTYATYLGGNGEDISALTNSSSLFAENSLCVSNNYIYVCGLTKSFAGLATSGAHQTSLSSGSSLSDHDLFLAQLEILDTNVYLQPGFNDTILCKGDSLYIPYGVSRNFRSNNVFTVQISNAAGSFSSGTTTLASVTANNAGVIPCLIPTSLTNGTGYKVRILASAPADTSIESGLDMIIGSYPANFTAASNTPICSGDTLVLTSNTSTTGVTFSWTGPNSFASSSKDNNILNTTTSNSGNYYITAQNGYCSLSDTLTVTVNQTPTKPILSSNAPICGGDTLKLYSTTTPTSGVTYAWSGPGFTSSLQDPMILNAQTFNSGTYRLTVSMGMCSDSDTIAIQVDAQPTISIVPTPGNDICDGQQVTFVAFASNAGATPAFQWLLNGSLTGNTTTTYSNSNIQSGDVVYCIMSTANCNGNYTDTSNIVNMTVWPIRTPTVSITANPTPPVAPWTLVNFSTATVNGGSNPSFQWKRNGQDVVGATSNTWGTYQLSDGDVVTVVMHSDYKCAVPDSAMSNAITMQLNLGVNNLTTGALQLYPNPNNGSFTIKGAITDNETIDLTLINKLGQTVYHTTINPINNKIDTHININKELATGMYLLQLRTEDGVSTLKLMIQ